MTAFRIARGSKPAAMRLAVVAPVGLLAVALSLWWISDRLLYIGPLDRAAFSWIFVVPMWLAAAPVAGIVWARVPTRERLLAATVFATLVGTVAGLIYWLSSSAPACEFGSLWSPEATAGRAVIIGVGVGGGPAVAGLLAAVNGRGSVARTVVIGTVAGVVTSLFSLLLIGMMLMVPMCQRPPAG